MMRVGERVNQITDIKGWSYMTVATVLAKQAALFKSASPVTGQVFRDMMALKISRAVRE